MPGVERLQERFRAANTQVLGISIDSKFCHAGWAVSLGGISFPLLQDFQPKGAVAKSFDLYLEDAGITDRATVIIDADGVVKHISSVTPAGSRDIAELAALCEDVNKNYGKDLDGPKAPIKYEGSSVLYYKSNCGFSNWALQARINLHLEGAVTLKNISEDDAAKNELDKATGKTQAPCLKTGDEWLFESNDIIERLAKVAPV